jgi:hypothetical protein
VGLRLRLRIEPPPLAALPWEFTLLKQAAGEPVASDFLCLQHDVSITRYETLGIPLKPLKSKDSIRIVIALANPDSDRPQDIDIEADKTAIQSAIRGVNATLGPTARDAVEARVTGLDAEADDYFVKPFAMVCLASKRSLDRAMCSLSTT